MKGVWCMALLSCSCVKGSVVLLLREVISVVACERKATNSGIAIASSSLEEGSITVQVKPLCISLCLCQVLFSDRPSHYRRSKICPFSTTKQIQQSP